MKNSLTYLKTHLIIPFVIVFSSLSVFAQYHPFPTENARWVNQYQNYYLDDNGMPHYTDQAIDNFCTNSLDTTINNISYKQLDLCTVNNSEYWGAIRYDAGQVYLVPKDSITEFLAYDFSMNIGETKEVIIKSPWPGDESYFIHSITVEQIDLINVNGADRKKIYFEGSDYAVIEGIGSTSGLFKEPTINISNYFVDLMCMSYQDSTHYRMDNGPLTISEPGNCDLTLNVDQVLQSSSSISIFPNPSQGQLTINNTSGKQLAKVRLYNIYGQLISDFTLENETQFQLEIKGEVGVYIIEILTKDGNRINHKIVKE